MLVGTSKRTCLGLGHFPSPRQSLFCSSHMRWALALSSRGDIRLGCRQVLTLQKDMLLRQALMVKAPD